MKGFHAKTQYNIRLSARKGVEIVKGAEADIDTFTRIMEVTGKRDGFVTRDEEYFKRLYRILKPKGIVELYLAKINPVKAIAHLQKQLDDTQRQLNRLDKTEGREKAPLNPGNGPPKRNAAKKAVKRYQCFAIHGANGERASRRSRRIRGNRSFRRKELLVRIRGQ
ncbi:peptidoglycan bridge formation glycyltransferase FemA/FemB family protein [Paenibacillus larvae]|uniref:peptidoglycan bridge formation glycyltransferase FemA/FemB family protein n=1 Tax=Paenibacillus larvae TaxID=1464 RepID=UPI00288D89C9|nr:peptidoglycan bridge formation glycyltransferase FemA/FemB family protein [Paenibacillus larvae]MDT2194401.1 peptidoglycan bridge formation glycyltransferase FemA/FemB family protein [Paenibacillus larvae]